jgi:hypothetical protein
MPLKRRRFRLTIFFLANLRKLDTFSIPLFLLYEPTMKDKKMKQIASVHVFKFRAKA